MWYDLHRWSTDLECWIWAWRRLSLWCIFPAWTDDSLQPVWHCNSRWERRYWKEKYNSSFRSCTVAIYCIYYYYPAFCYSYRPINENPLHVFPSSEINLTVKTNPSPLYQLMIVYKTNAPLWMYLPVLLSLVVDSEAVSPWWYLCQWIHPFSRESHFVSLQNTYKSKVKHLKHIRKNCKKSCTK